MAWAIGNVTAVLGCSGGLESRPMIGGHGARLASYSGNTEWTC